MKSIASLIAIAICTVVLAGLTARDVASADEFRWKHKRHHRIASVEPWPAPCEGGWWQTLRYGHVRPRWGMRCY